MEIKLSKWGNSFAIRLPKNILDQLEISQDDSLDLTIKDKQIVLKKNNYGEYSIRELAEKYYGKPFDKCKNMIQNDEYDWGSPVGNEVW